MNTKKLIGLLLVFSFIFTALSYGEEMQYILAWEEKGGGLVRLVDQDYAQAPPGKYTIATKEEAERVFISRVIELSLYFNYRILNESEFRELFLLYVDTPKDHDYARMVNNELLTKEQRNAIKKADRKWIKRMKEFSNMDDKLLTNRSLSRKDLERLELILYLRRCRDKNLIDDKQHKWLITIFMGTFGDKDITPFFVASDAMIITEEQRDEMINYLKVFVIERQIEQQQWFLY